MRVIAKERLPTVRINGEVAAHIFDGKKHADTTVSAFVVDLASGPGPRRHQHPYDEIFIVIEGQATPDEFVLVPRDTQHGFSDFVDEVEGKQCSGEYQYGAAHQGNR